MSTKIRTIRQQEGLFDVSKINPALLMKCPVCSFDGVPIRLDPADGREGYHMFHPGRGVSCSIGRDDNGAEQVGARLDELDRVAAAIAGVKACTEQISTSTEWRATIEGHINSHESFKNLVHGQDFGVDTWEGDGGFCPPHED